MLNKKYPGARIRVVLVSMELLVDPLVQDHEFPRMTVTQGLPVGAEFVAVMPDWQRGVVELVYMHDSFDAVAVGAYVPEHQVAITAHYDDVPARLTP